MSPRGDREGLLRKILATPPGEYRVDDFTALLVCDRVALASEAKVHPSTMRHAPQSDDVLDANPVAATPTRAE